MIMKSYLVNILFIGTLTCLNISCFGFLIPYNNSILLRNKRQASQCKGKLMCNSFTKCISINQICNRIKDCPDGSDENPEECKLLNPEFDGSCLPFIIENGNFTIVGEVYESITLIPNYAIVEISCQSNYFLIPDKPMLSCLDGVWNYPIPKCKPKCPPRISTSATVNCTLNDKVVDCNEDMSEGTISLSICKNFYIPIISNISISTCIDGNWDNPLIQCEPECGEVVPEGIIYLNDTEAARRGEFPWTVAIYRKINVHIFNLYCGGNIITPNIILTVAHCVTKSNKKPTTYPPEQFTIGAGKYFNDISNDKDKQAQLRQVIKIHILSEYDGEKSFYSYDIALLVVKEPFEMTNVVRPVCIDWENKFEAEQLQNNNFGSFSGWINTNEFDLMSLKLELLSLPYIDTEVCLKEIPIQSVQYLTPDKFCNGFSSISHRCRGISGHGLVFDKIIDNKQIFFIRGLLSVSLTYGDLCDIDSRAASTRVSYYLDFIHNIITRTEQDKFTCLPRISSTANITCSLDGISVNCNERMEEGTIVVSRCKESYITTHKQNFIATCMNGFWDNPPLKCELQEQNRFRTICRPRTSDSVNIKCLYNNNPVNCNENLLDGAIAISECKHFFTPKKGQNSVAISRCSNGIWNTPLIQCEALKPINIECGEIVSKGEIQSVNTANIKRGEFPWHVGLYQFFKSKFKYTCGGSIVTDNIVLTAAHCMTDEYGKRFPAQNFYIAAGKYYSDYNAKEDKLAQKRQVMEYHTPPIYKGYETNFAGDIAVVVVKKSFVLNTAVQPVCVEWDDKIESQQLQPNNRGSVVGWGSTDPFDITKISKELKQLNAPYVDITQCLHVVPQNFRRWVTTDKFCAGFTNGSSICKGDSGGGMVFEWKSNNTQKYFIRGIVSVGPSDTKKSLICDNFKYGAYTLVSFYSRFILNIIKQYNNN